MERTPVASMTTISPGSSSRTKWAPTTSSAGDSEASTHPDSSRPRQSGRKPLGSRTPMMWPSSIATIEKAPSRRGSTLAMARSSARSSLRSSLEAGSSRWIISATRSLSLVTMPGSIPASSASSSVLTRLPL